MSLHNDYLINIVAKQQHTELLDRAAEDRLARLLPSRPAPWWRRFVVGRRRTQRPRLGGAGSHRAARVGAVPIHSGTCGD
jgi:hypothetical protein